MDEKNTVNKSAVLDGLRLYVREKEKLWIFLAGCLTPVLLGYAGLGLYMAIPMVFGAEQSWQPNALAASLADYLLSPLPWSLVLTVAALLLFVPLYLLRTPYKLVGEWDSPRKRD